MDCAFARETPRRSHKSAATVRMSPVRRSLKTSEDPLKRLLQCVLLAVLFMFFSYEWITSTHSRDVQSRWGTWPREKCELARVAPGAAKVHGRGVANLAVGMVRGPNLPTARRI